MSLKARIEAVIYAAEEPVTLAQLAALFREEALASREARRAAEAAVLGGDGDSEPETGLVPSEQAAQNSADAEVAVPDFASEPQPFPNQPPEATTPGRENDAAVRADAQRPEHADTSATLASSATAAVAELAGATESCSAEAERGGPAAQPEDEKKAARALEREIRAEVRSMVDELIADYSVADSGLEIREVAGGFRFATRPEYHDAVRAFVKSLKPPMKLSLQALETLAVIAYKQPVTAPEIGEIRGVDSGGVLGSLVARKLITTAGRKQVIGRPILYKTTKEFLLRFGLKDLNELPSIEEFEKMASELAEAEEASGSPEAGAELPFAQNEIAALEENAEGGERAALMSAEGETTLMKSGDELEAPVKEPAEPEPPVGEPGPEPEPVGEPGGNPEEEPDGEPERKLDEEPEPESDAAPTSEYDEAGPGSGDPIPPPEDDGRARMDEDREP